MIGPTAAEAVKFGTVEADYDRFYILSFYFPGRCENTFCPRTGRMDLEHELQPELHHAVASRTDERITGRDVGCGAPAAE